MSYRTQFRGSPWQQDSYAFNVSRYREMYGGYGLNSQFSMMASRYYPEGYRSAYGSGAISYYRSMGYSNPSALSYYLSDRTSGSYQSFCNQIQQKRLPQRIPSASPGPKRLKLESDSRQGRSKMRWRRRDSRRSKRSNKADNKSVGPSGNASDVNYDDYDSWECSEGENEASASQDKKQQSVNVSDKSKVETSESDKTKDPKKPLACHVCKVTCSTLERFGNHMTSRTHKANMDMLLVLQKEKTQVLEASMKASQQVKSQDRLKKDRRKRGQWCTVCEHAYSGGFLTHRRTRGHRKNRDKKFPKCRLCGVGFTNTEEYQKHCKGENHKMKSAEFHYVKNLASGSDDDTAATEPVQIQTPVFEAMLEKDKTAANSGSVERCEKKEAGDSECKPSAAAKEILPVGQLFVVPAKGYYCKICHKFFRDVTVAKVKHCCSITHSESFKKTMKEAMKQEEERQNIADEQEKLKEKTAEFACDDVQITAVEKAAEEIIKEETQKTRDPESEKNSNQTENTAFENSEVCKIADVVETEQTEVVTEEIKEDAEKIKGQPVTGKVEQLVHEIALSDSQSDKESEGTKKECPSSRGARRSRGRGRRR